MFLQVLPAVREWLVERGLPFTERTGYFEVEFNP
jgi:hypothetical protein